MGMRGKFVILLVAIALGCIEPTRPRGVPADAVWAGGREPGAWINCEQTTKEPYAAFRCAIYRRSGQPWASGHFIHARRENGQWVAVGAPFVNPAPYAYDGTLILRRDGTALIPWDMIER
jgi:hypothetical protein